MLQKLSLLKNLRLSKTQNILPAVFATRSFNDITNSLKSPTFVYDKMVSSGKIKDDAMQRLVLNNFETLYKKIIDYESSRIEKENFLEEVNKKLENIEEKELEVKTNETSKGSSWFYGNERKISLFGNLFSSQKSKKFCDADIMLKKNLLAEREALNQPKGVYVHGGPGSGKTFLMDIFYHSLPFAHKRRVHFNEFMLEIHRMLHKLSKRGYTGSEMMKKCVQDIVQNTKILCFDEFQVTDIADAMIMKQLFSALYRYGVIIIMTSNRQIDELYKNGIQRDLFIPFLDELKQNYDVIEMVSDTDYRKIKMNAFNASNASKLYFLQQDSAEMKLYENLWRNLTQSHTSSTDFLKVQGRKVPIRYRSINDDVARFNFFDLCGKAIGASDYQTLSLNFHTVFIDNIPQLTLAELNQIRRFITLIDTFYDQKIVLAVSAACAADNLLDLGNVQSEEEAAQIQLQETDLLGLASYVPAQANVDEVFAFHRTISRLNEMQTEEYLNEAKESKRFHKKCAPYRFFKSIGIENDNMNSTVKSDALSKL